MTLKNTLKLVVVLLAMLVLKPANAQDAHFSQFYASPITLNPAMTGLMNNCHRFVTNYRNQYPLLYNTYNSFAVSYDAALMRGMMKNDFIGAGIMFLNDRQGDGSLNNMQIMGSFAFHKAVDPKGQVLISVGAQAGWMNKSVNFGDLVFESQFDDSTGDFNTSLPNGEAVERNSFSNFDIRLGGMVSANINKLVGVYGGAGYYHVTKPEERFLVEEAGADYRLDPRLVIHAGANITPSNQISITPNLLFQTQSGAREIIIGSNVGYHFSDGRKSSGTSIYGGLAYRIGSDITALVGAEFDQLKFGISYDVAVGSVLGGAAQGQGGIEFSVGYELGCNSSVKRGYPPVSCPRF